MSRYRLGYHELKRNSVDARHVHPRAIADEHRLRSHCGPTVLSQKKEWQEENRADRASTTPQTPPPTSGCCHNCRCHNCRQHKCPLHPTDSNTSPKPRFRADRVVSRSRDDPSQRQRLPNPESSSCVRQYDEQRASRSGVIILARHTLAGRRRHAVAYVRGSREGETCRSARSVKRHSILSAQRVGKRSNRAHAVMRSIFWRVK